METGREAHADGIGNFPLETGRAGAKPESVDFEGALATAPDNLERLNSLADKILGKGLLDEASAAYRKILDLDQTNARALVALSRIDRRLGDNWSACNRLRVAHEKNPDNLQVLTDFAAVLRDLDLSDEAASIYRQILTKDKAHVQSHIGLGWIARANDNNEAALEHFAVAHEHLRETASAEPNNLHVLTQLAIVLRALNRRDEAKAIHLQILATDSKHVQSHIGLGWIAFADGNDEAALRHFQAAAALDQLDLQIRISVAKALLRMGRFEEAEMSFQRVITRAPKHAQAHASLAALARRRDDWPAALEEFRAAVQSDPRNISFRLDLARTFCDLSRWEDAEQTYRAVLQDSPLNIDALMGLATIAKDQGDSRTALALYKEASAAAPLDLRPKQEIRNLMSSQGIYDWQTEIDDALAVSRAADVPARTQLEAAKILVEYGLTEAARPLLCKLEARFPAARQLLLAVRQIDRMGLAQPTADSSATPDPSESQLESLQGFVERPVPGSDTVLIVFGGTNNRLWMTFSLLHKILRKTGVSVVYCRDLQRVWYAGGIIGLGHDFQSTVEGLRTLVARYGAKRVLMLGNCIGCLGALRFGLALGVQGVLGISPKLRLVEDLEPHERAQLRPTDERRPPVGKNIHAEYVEVSSRPNVTLIFGEDCAGDAYNANAMADIPGVSVTAIPASRDTDSVKDLLVRGLLEPVLHDFVRNGIVSEETHALISTSRNPEYCL